MSDSHEARDGLKTVYGIDLDELDPETVALVLGTAILVALDYIAIAHAGIPRKDRDEGLTQLVSTLIPVFLKGDHRLQEILDTLAGLAAMRTATEPAAPAKVIDAVDIFNSKEHHA